MAVARNLEWLNANALRAYPFRENVTLIPLVNGAPAPGIRIPVSAVVDFVITVADTGAGRIYMSALIKAGGYLTFTFADATDTPVALVAVNSATHTPNQGYAFSGVDSYEDARGRLVLGDLSELLTYIPDGQWVMDMAGGEMESTTIRPMLRGVRSIQVDNDGALSAKLYGHVKLVSGSNIRLTVDEDTNSIRIDALDTTGFQEACECEAQEVITPVLTVNGIGIADLVIEGDGKCVAVSTEGNRLIISDTCSAPCCGCPEQDFLVKHLELLEHTLARVEASIDDVRERQQEYETKTGVSMR